MMYTDTAYLHSLSVYIIFRAPKLSLVNQTTNIHKETKTKNSYAAKLELINCISNLQFSFPNRKITIRD